MTAIRCFIVDDEPLARTQIVRLLNAQADFEVCASFEEGRQALDCARETPPDLVFLDVKMPGMGGMEFLAALQLELPIEDRPYVILVTAFDRFALQAFEYDALDYLVKPFDDARFESSMGRARERIRRRNQARQLESTDNPAGPNKLHLKAGNRDVLIDTRSIAWIESADHYLYVHVAERSHLVRKTMSVMERELRAQRFLRVHRGALVNPAFVVEVRQKKDGGRWLVLREGSRIPVSRRRWPEIRARLDLGPTGQFD